MKQIGTYNPIPFKDNVKEVTANVERLHYWVSCGAQPSDRVAWLFGRLGILPTPPIRNGTKYLIPKSIQKNDKAK